MGFYSNIVEEELSNQSFVYSQVKVGDLHIQRFWSAALGLEVHKAPLLKQLHTPPKTENRYLLPSEHQVSTVHHEVLQVLNIEVFLGHGVRHPPL